MGKDRQLHPKTEELLESLNIDSRLTKGLVEVDHDGTNREKGRFIFPVKSLIRVIRERAMMPKKLRDEHKQKLVEVGQRSR